MPAQIPIDRVSIKTSLEDRYKNQKCGGAYDVKSIQTVPGSRMPILSSDGVGSAITELKWTNQNFAVKQDLMITEFKDSSLKYIDTTGFSSKKYKP